MVRKLPLAPIQKISYAMGVRFSLAEFHMDKRLDLSRFEEAVRQMLLRHPLLRTTINLPAEEMLELSCPEHLSISVMDLTFMDRAKKDIIIGKARELYSFFDQENKYTGETPAQTMLILKGGEKEYIFLMPCSHLVFDGMSHERFCSQLLELYDRGPSEKAEAIMTYDYMDYLNQLKKGPLNTSQYEIIAALELDDFEIETRFLQQSRRTEHPSC